MPAVHAFGEFLCVNVFDDGTSLGIRYPHRIGNRFPVVAEGGHYEILQRSAAGKYLPDRVAPVRRGRLFFDLSLEPLYVFLPPGIVAQFRGKVDVQDVSPVHDFIEPKRSFDRRALFKQGFERVGDGFIGLDDRALCGKGEGKEPAEKDAERSFHDFFCLLISIRRTMREPKIMARKSAMKSFGSPLR